MAYTGLTPPWSVMPSTSLTSWADSKMIDSSSPIDLTQTRKLAVLSLAWTGTVRERSTVEQRDVGLREGERVASLALVAGVGKVSHGLSIYGPERPERPLDLEGEGGVMEACKTAYKHASGGLERVGKVPFTRGFRVKTTQKARLT